MMIVLSEKPSKYRKKEPHIMKWLGSRGGGKKCPISKKKGKIKNTRMSDLKHKTTEHVESQIKIFNRSKGCENSFAISQGSRNSNSNLSRVGWQRWCGRREATNGSKCHTCTWHGDRPKVLMTTRLGNAKHKTPFQIWMRHDIKIEMIDLGNEN